MDLSNKVTYEVDINETEGDSLLITWDVNDDEINSVMHTDIHPHIETKTNYFWVSVLKTSANWERGKYVYALLKNNGKGYVRVYYSMTRASCYGDLLIDSEGYLHMRYYNNYSNKEDIDEGIYYSFLMRPNCFYNDSICNTTDENP